MVIDGCFQGRGAAETLSDGPRLRLWVLRPGQVHLREGAVVDAEDHLVAACAFDYCRQLMPGQFVISADFGSGLSDQCRAVPWFWPEPRLGWL